MPLSTFENSLVYYLGLPCKSVNMCNRESADRANEAFVDSVSRLTSCYQHVSNTQKLISDAEYATFAPGQRFDSTGSKTSSENGVCTEQAWLHVYRRVLSTVDVGAYSVPLSLLHTGNPSYIDKASVDMRLGLRRGPGGPRVVVDAHGAFQIKVEVKTRATPILDDIRGKVADDYVYPARLCPVDTRRGMAGVVSRLEDACTRFAESAIECHTWTDAEHRQVRDVLLPEAIRAGVARLSQASADESAVVHGEHRVQLVCVTMLLDGLATLLLDHRGITNCSTRATVWAGWLRSTQRATVSVAPGRQSVSALIAGMETRLAELHAGAGA